MEERKLEKQASLGSNFCLWTHTEMSLCARERAGPHIGRCRDVGGRCTGWRAAGWLAVRAKTSAGNGQGEAPWWDEDGSTMEGRGAGGVGDVDEKDEVGETLRERERNI